MNRVLALLLPLWLISVVAFSQIEEPFTWKSKLETTPGGDKQLVFTVEMEEGWHIYGTNIPEGGPVATSFVFENIKGATLVGKPVSKDKMITEYDEQFAMKLSWYAHKATFVQKLKVTDPNGFSVAGYIKYMGCNDKSCLPPAEFPFSFGEKGTATTTQKTVVTAFATDSPAQAATAVIPATKDTASSPINDLWKPVISELHSFGENAVTASTSGWLIFLYGFLGGLLALMTPCVWPMIPMTVSFFLKRAQDRRKAVSQAITYGLAIIVIYLALGLLITAFFGASALNELSTNALFNLIFFALLVLFAVSFFGAFELVLPSSWTNKLDQKADATSGLISIFFMAFTLSLVSFSCTGPIIGTLLVQAASMGDLFGPAVGMFGFALALAIPFALFALFPSWLKQMPKSGSWLNSVKVVLGFLELALAFKFFSVADLAYGWRILDREVFLVVWIVIFFLLGVYLLGKLKLPHDSDLKFVSVPRLFLAIVSFSFALYMVPGLWGAPLKAISAFSPPLNTQDFNLYTNEVHAKFDDYESGMAYARQNNKPVVVDFTGFGCVNCRKMEAAVWTDANVKKLLEQDYVLISLYVDNKKPLPETIVVNENGQERKLRTLGDKWSYLQRHKFGANAQPYYVLLNANGQPIGPAYTFDEDAGRFVQYLKTGLATFRK